MQFLKLWFCKHVDIMYSTFFISLSRLTAKGWLSNGFRSTYNYSNSYNACSYIFMQTRDYAARKGTREKARKKKVKVVIEKVGFVPYKKRDKLQKVTVSPLVNISDSWKREAVDNVWITKYHRRPVYSVEEAIQCHCETHHSTIFNEPDSPISAYIDLDMKREKKNRYVEKFTKVIDTPHIFKYSKGERKILALSKDLEQQKSATNAGADFVGGIEVIKQIQNGAFLYKEYDHIVAHADILTELLLIRGLLKKKFPNVKAGTLRSTDLGKLVEKFKYGIQYAVRPHEVHKDYGQIIAIFGLLNMDTKQLVENFSALISDVESVKPKPPFIQRVCINSEVSKESFKIDFKQYLPKTEEEEPENEAEENVGVISVL